MINTLVYEGLGEHLKKHWGKYALALGTAGLAGAGLAKHQQHKSSKFAKRFGIGAGLATAGLAAHQIYHYNKAENALKRIDKIAQKRNNYINNLLTKAKNKAQPLVNQIENNYKINKISAEERQKYLSQIASQAKDFTKKLNNLTAKRVNQLNRHAQNAQKYSIFHRFFNRSYHS